MQADIPWKQLDDLDNQINIVNEQLDITAKQLEELKKIREILNKQRFELSMVIKDREIQEIRNIKG